MRTVSMMLVRAHVVAALLCAGAKASAATSATSADAEPVHLVVDAPEGCTSESELATAVKSLGGNIRAPRARERARTFVIVIRRDDAASPTAAYAGTFAIRSLDNRETTRSLTAMHCEEVAASMAFFASVAIAEPSSTPETVTPSASDETSDLRGYEWPTAPPPDRRVKPPGRVGSGGIAVSGFAAGSQYGTATGIHAYAAARVGQAMRVGLAASIANEERQRPHEESADNAGATHNENFIGNGVATRVGALLGWHGPWNDSVAGFSGEVGVAAGAERGTKYISDRRRDRDGFPTYASDRIVEVRRSFASPYVLASVVLQVPFRGAVRPIVALGTIWTPMRSGEFAVFAEAGLAWQAW